MKVVITGSTGMIGSIVLTNCLNDDQITEIVSFVRKPGKLKHAKLTEIVIQNFENYSEYREVFKEVKTVFFCLGVYTGQVPDELFKKITVDYALACAKSLEKNSPKATFCLLSGAGADRTEKSKTSFARYKGMAENQISALYLEFYSFRPGYIYPVVPRKEPNFGYRIMRALYPLMKIFGTKYSITSVELANSIYHIGMNGAPKEILENQDILEYKELI